MSEHIYGKVKALKLVTVPAAHQREGLPNPRLFIQISPMHGRDVIKDAEVITMDCGVGEAKLNGTVIKVGTRLSCYADKGAKVYVLNKLDRIYEEKEASFTRSNKNKGAEVGNAINVATHLTGSFDPLVVGKCAEDLLSFMQDMRDLMATNYPSMDAFARNMRLGQSFLLASQDLDLHYLEDGWKDRFEKRVAEWFALGCELETK